MEVDGGRRPRSPRGGAFQLATSGEFHMAIDTVQLREANSSATSSNSVRILKAEAMSGRNPPSPHRLLAGETGKGLSGCYSNRLGDIRGLVADLECEADRPV